MASPSHAGRPNKLFRNLNAKIASIPMVLTAMVIFLGGTIWTVVYSFTNSKLLPRASFVGFDQYERLWDAPRWVMSIQNLAIYGILSLIFSIVIGFVLAAATQESFFIGSHFLWAMLITALFAGSATGAGESVEPAASYSVNDSVNEQNARH